MRVVAVGYLLFPVVVLALGGLLPSAVVAAAMLVWFPVAPILVGVLASVARARPAPAVRADPGGESSAG